MDYGYNLVKEDMFDACMIEFSYYKHGIPLSLRDFSLFKGECPKDKGD